MPKAGKRAAPTAASSATTKRSKKDSLVKVRAPPSFDSKEESSGDEADDQEGAEDPASLSSEGEELSEAADELEDDEVNEFELDDEDELIGDDEEDLMAGLVEDEDGEDDSSSAGPGSDATPTTPLALKKANVRNSRAAAPLKPAELRALAFAELTASPISNFISTETARLLSPITPPAPATSPLQPLLKSLHAHITNLPAQKATSLAGLRKQGRVVPPVEGSEGKWGGMDLSWEKPRAEDVRIVGRWAWGGGYKAHGEYVVDMAVAMPATLLQPKDYLAPRFLIKSTHYLTVLASLLPSTLGPTTLSYVPLPGTQGWALEIRSAHAKGTDKVGLAKIRGAVLRLRVVWPSEAFQAAKTSPASNVARPGSLSATPDQSASFPATPLRTTSLLFSSLDLLTAHLKFHHALTTSHPSYPSTVRLLQSWASRRSYGACLGLSPEWWAWCVARTLNWGAGKSAETGSAAVGGEAWAGWRKAVEWLASVNWIEGVWFRVEGDKAYPKDEFRTAFAGRPLFVDPTGTVNLAAGIDLATLEMLQLDARTTIALLLADIGDEQKFDGAFVHEVRAAERFDNFARITVSSSLLSSSLVAEASLDHSSALSSLVSAMSSTLRRALGTRAKAFLLSAPESTSIAVKGPTSLPSHVVLHLGVILDAAEAGRLVDQGPSAEDEAACADFRAFWGAKSELRRFKDGAILESVVWDAPSQGGLGQQRNKVVSQIISYILESRHGILAASIDVFAGAMDHLLVEPEAVRRAIFLEDSVATSKGFGSIVGAFDALAKELKDLPDLPLSVSAVQPCSQGLRYSTIFTPSPRRLKEFGRFPDATKYIPVHDILLTLESSGRWPDDLEGVQKIKAAFLAKIGEGLSKVHTIVRAEVALDLSALPLDDNVSLEILTSTGYAFRARIFYERSLLLLQKRATKLGGAGAPSADKSMDVYNERFVDGPRHHAALATLQHHFTSYSPTVRLVNRWLSSHMLTAYFPPELVEIISASVFIDPSSIYEPPQSGATGFARVMGKLATWNWRDEPMLVPLYSFSHATTSGRRATFPALRKAVARSAFESQRLRDPAVNEFAWMVCTEEDQEGRVWGRATSRIAAARVRSLATATLKTMNDGLQTGSLNVEQLFNPPLKDYNFLIHLDPSVIPRHYQSLAPDASALAPRPRSSILSGSLMGQVDDGDVVRLGWDPVADFVREVELLYPSTFLLFYSPDGSPTIGGIWNPAAEAPRPWKVGLGFPCEPIAGSEGKAKVQLDKKCVAREIEKLGRGLVKNVELMTGVSPA